MYRYTINNTFFFATIDKVFYYVSSVLTTCFVQRIHNKILCQLLRKKKKVLFIILIIGVCILLRVISTVNYNTFCFATIDKVFYLVVSVLTTCLGP
jgi:hypothetical protein